MLSSVFFSHGVKKAVLVSLPFPGQYPQAGHAKGDEAGSGIKIQKIRLHRWRAMLSWKVLWPAPDYFPTVRQAMPVAAEEGGGSKKMITRAPWVLRAGALGPLFTNAMRSLGKTRKIRTPPPAMSQMEGINHGEILP